MMYDVIQYPIQNKKQNYKGTIFSLRDQAKVCNIIHKRVASYKPKYSIGRDGDASALSQSKKEDQND